MEEPQHFVINWQIHFDSLATNNVGLLRWLKQTVWSLDAEWYSFYHYVNIEMVWKWIFYRYRTLISIKWFEPLSLKRGIFPLLFNAESTTYPLCISKKNFLDLNWRKKKETTLLTITYFLFCQKSPPSILVLHYFSFFFWLWIKKRG